MFRFSASRLLYVPKGVGISPFSMFLIDSKKSPRIPRNRVAALTMRYKQLSATERSALNAMAAAHPSFSKLSMQRKYVGFIRRKYPKLHGRCADRMKRIGGMWRQHLVEYRYAAARAMARKQ